MNTLILMAAVLSHNSFLFGSLKKRILILKIKDLVNVILKTKDLETSSFGFAQDGLIGQLRLRRHASPRQTIGGKGILILKTNDLENCDPQNKGLSKLAKKRLV